MCPIFSCANKWVNPYVRRYRVHLAALFGSIFWKSRKIVKMMNFEHVRVAKSLEKYILFDKNCLPGKKHQQTSSPNLQSWPFWIAGLIRLDLSNFDPWKNILRLEKKFQTIFSIISMGNVVYYTKNMLTTVFLKGNGNFWKVASFGVTYRLLTILVTWRFQDHTWYHQNDEFWASEGCKISGKGISIDKTAIYMYICVVYHSKSLQRVYCGIFWQHFLVKIQKMWNKRFFPSIFVAIHSK